jgi:hypothetical protein
MPALAAVAVTVDAWQARRRAHLERLAPVLARLRAFFQAGPHPVYDFLRTYYSFPLSGLEAWSPGVGQRLENAAGIFAGQRFWATEGADAFLDPAQFPERRREGLERAIELLAATAARPGTYGCHGLHEWAMVYRPAPGGVRHGQVPLRMAPDQLADFVDSQRIRCSHWDAYRFFTPAARPLNLLQPAPDNRPRLEQPGCLHANMDLYKWSYKFHPWIPGELLADTFLLALEIRELDMRASPYDLRAHGFDPVPIETPEGRASYEACQRGFAQRAVPLRARLLEGLEALRDAV